MEGNNSAVLCYPQRNVRRKDLARETPEVPIIAEQSAALKTHLWLCGSYSKGQNTELLSSPGSFCLLVSSIVSGRGRYVMYGRILCT